MYIVYSEGCLTRVLNTWIIENYKFKYNYTGYWLVPGTWEE